MLILLSPAKSLDYESPLPSGLPSDMTPPRFETDSGPLIDLLRTKSAEDLAHLMDISAPLAQLNVQRFSQWQPGASGHAQARPALYAFNGDVYEGLQASTLQAKDVVFAQERLRILSGLYGLLRPLDALQPYRLEMGTRLPNPRGKDLYAYWQPQVTALLAKEMSALGEAAWILNLASQEYAKVVQPQGLPGPMISPQFLDGKAGGKSSSSVAYKVVSFYAKRARGLMARYAIERRIDHPDGLLAFDAEGYRFSAEHSKPMQPAFIRAL